MIEQLTNTLLLHMDGNREPGEPLRYLEIGVDNGHTFVEILATTPTGREVIKVGVDPYGVFQDGITRMTSQMFFALNETFWHQEFDIIYIDGCHFSPIVDQEISERLKILKPNGVILLDDTIPLKESSGTVCPEDLVKYCEKVSYPMGIDHTEADKHFSGYPHVQGDVWKSVAKLRMRNPDVSICSVGNMCTTLVMRGQQELIDEIPPEEMDWNFYANNINEILQPVTSFDDIANYVKKNENLR